MFVNAQVHKLAHRLCRASADSHDMPPSAARVGTWLVGRAVSVGGLPIETSFRQIKAGTGCHHNTIKKAVEWLCDNNVIRISDGSIMRAGATAMKVDAA